MKNNLWLRLVSALTLTMALFLTGCATSGNSDDPLESYNRTMFDINDVIDRNVLQPIARGYKSAAPEMVDKGVSNFFGNLRDIGSAVNNLLQGKVEAGLDDVSRVMINSTVGLGGIFDVASDAGIKKHEEDFGQTLAKWGVGSGPYIVLPLLGPSTARGTGGLVVDTALNPTTYVDGWEARTVLTAADVVDRRADALRATKIFDGGLFGDKYSAAKEAYLGRREFLINDENY